MRAGRESGASERAKMEANDDGRERLGEGFPLLKYLCVVLAMVSFLAVMICVTPESLPWLGLANGRRAIPRHKE